MLLARRAIVAPGNSSQSGTGWGAGGVVEISPTPDYMLPSSAKLTTGKTLQARAVYLGSDLWPVDASGVAWSTSDAAIATVSSSGLVTAVALGSCTITATKGAASVTLAMTVASSVTVAYILMQPLVQTIPQNGLGACFARPYDVDGVLIAGQTHTWTYSNGSLVTASGLRGVAASSNGSGRKMQATTTEGSTTVTATNGGVSGTMTLTVSDALAPSASTEPYVPAGWTTLREDALDSITDKTNYNFQNAGDGKSTLSLESDATAPKSPNNVMRNTIVGGRTGGNVNANVEVSLGASYGSLYFCHWYNKSTNYVAENAGTKIGFIQSLSSATINHYWGLDSDTAGNEQFLFGTQQSGYASRGIYAPYCAKPYDRWRKYRLRLTPNTGDNADGRVEVWVDDIKILDAQDVLLSGVTTSPSGFGKVLFGGTFSFPVVTPMPDIYEQFDHLLIAVP